MARRYINEVRVHQLVDSDTTSRLQDVLSELRRYQAHPSALTLYSRLKTGQFTAHSYLVLIGHLCSEDHAQPWSIAFVDRSRRPETELYMFSSWDAADEIEAAAEKGASYECMASVFRKIKDMAKPESIHAHTGADSVLSCGAIGSRTLEMLQDRGWIAPAHADRVVPYRAFLFKTNALPAVTALPDGLVWSSLRPEDFESVRTTSTIARQEQTLKSLPSVAIFDSRSDRIAGWGFVGLDGSLSTLYVMPEYRGQGLATTLCLKLLTDKMDGIFGGEDLKDWLGHSYVALDNEASIRTAKRAGGKEARSLTYWPRMDLDKI